MDPEALPSGCVLPGGGWKKWGEDRVERARGSGAPVKTERGRVGTGRDEGRGQDSGQKEGEAAKEGLDKAGDGDARGVLG